MVFVMADLSGLEQQVRSAAAQRFADAVDAIERELVEAAPVGEPDPLGRGRVGPRLKDTFRRGAVETSANGYRVMVGFTAPQATFSNDLMPRHFITPRGPYPLRFYSPKKGGVVYTMKVDHPGNVASASLGWWDKAMTPDRWTGVLERAL